MTSPPPIGVVIVTYNSADVIAECLEGLFASRNATPYVVVVDNASQDGTRQVIRDWAAGTLPFQWRDDCPLPDPVAAGKPVAFTVCPHDTDEPPSNRLTLVEFSGQRRLRLWRQPGPWPFAPTARDQ